MKVVLNIILLTVSIGLFAQRPAPSGIRVFGNSISLGTGLSDTLDRFGNLLADDFGITEYNGSIGGMTLVENNFYEEEAMDYFEDSLLNINSDSNDIAIVMFGTNDMTMIDRWDLPYNQTYADQYRSFLSIIIDSLLDKGFDHNRIIIASDPFSNAFDPVNSGEGADSVDNITYEVAYNYGAIWVDMSDQINRYGIGDETWRDGYTVDGVHPGVSGHQIMYELFRHAYLLRNRPASYTIPTISEPSDYGSIVYIDPDWGGAQSGTISEPYTTIPSFSTNTAYLIKAGTTLDYTSYLGVTADNNYLGKYGVGDLPLIKFQLGISGSYLVMDSLHIQMPGAAYLIMLRLGYNTSNITIANSRVIGEDTGGGYPFNGLKSDATYFTAYKTEFAYTGNDGIYMGVGEGVTIVSCYFHHNNMDGVSVPASGDCVQIEHARADNGYVANNYMTREHTIWKFNLIVNSYEYDQINFIAEYNTFVSPNAGNGGAAVRWYAGDQNRFTKNLINTEPGVFGIASHSFHANQASPYGIRDNIEFGPMADCDACTETSNIDLSDWGAYVAYLATNSLDPYGSDLDTNDFFGTSLTAQASNPCLSAPIGISTYSVGNDTNDRGTGYVNITPTGGNGSLAYLWSNSEVTEDITGLLSGNYSVDITDDSSCVYNSQVYVVSMIDTVTNNDSSLTVDSVYTNLEDGVNVAVNMLDGNLGTRWSNNLDTAISIFVLDASYNIKSVSVAWYEGDLREAYFSIHTSLDSVSWTEVYSDTSSGATLDYENYDVTNSIGRYIKLEGYGNDKPTSSEWTSITEFRAYGDTASCTLEITDMLITNEVSGNGMGAVDATISGAKGSASYLWSNSETTEDITNLSAGQYTLTVTDDSSCTYQSSIWVYNKITVGGGGSIDTTTVDSILINVLGSTSGYEQSGWDTIYETNYETYNFSGGHSMYVINGGTPGTPGYTTGAPIPYNVQYSYNSGANITYTFTMDSDSLFVDLYIMSSREYFNGSLTSRLIIGTDTVDVDLEENVDWAVFKNIDLDVSNEFTLSQTSSGGRINAMVLVTKDTVDNLTGDVYYYPINYNSTTVNNSCYSDSSGSVDITSVFNGVAPYTHSWNIDSTGNSVTGLAEGTYYDTITDAVDSTLIATFNITSPDSIYYSVYSYDPTNENSNGHIVVSGISGGSGNYSIEWNNSETSLSIVDIPEGDYWFIITDGNGCKTDTVNVTLTNQGCPSLVITETITNPPHGAISLEVSGGEEPYYYIWNTGTSSQNLPSVPAGDYTVVVTDDNGCTGNEMYDLNRTKVKLTGAGPVKYSKIYNGKIMKSKY